MKLGLRGLLGDGDMPVVERGNLKLYFPIVTCIIVNNVVSFILWLLNR